MRLTDSADIRRRLEADRAWTIYALGDLTPGFWEHCDWFGAADGSPALILIYRAFAPPVIFAQGKAGELRGLLEEVGSLPQLYLSIQPEFLPVIRAGYDVEHEKAMWRMVTDAASFRPAPTEGVERLGPADVATLERLYADGAAAGEAPDFFSPAMVEQGVFCGVREGEQLIAVAGTHLVSSQESVGAVGNVYTRRDRRGRGLAARTTSAVTAELLRLGLRTIALNVNQQNATAGRVYERLGYRKYCPFVEGVAVRKS